jgi:hypothetical protein
MTDPLISTTKFLLSVRCLSLHIKKNVNFNKGMMSSLMDMARGPQVAKNERRRIKISQSAPYELSGRPPRYIYLYDALCHMTILIFILFTFPPLACYMIAFTSLKFSRTIRI